MKQISSISIRELSARQRIVDLALTDVEDFRAQGFVACRNYTKKQRKALKKASTKTVSIYDILASWQDNLKPKVSKLSKEQKNPEFLNSIVKHLSTSEILAQEKINALTKDRQLEMLNDFAFDIYEKPKKGRDKFEKRRNKIKEIMSVSEKEVEKMKANFVEYTLFNETSENEKVTILDPYAPFLKRAKSKRRIERERKEILKKHRDRLNFIYSRLEELSKINNNLIEDILDKKWDLMIVLGLRNNYEKKIAKINDDQPDSATRRLAIFNNETKKFKEEELDKMEMLPGQSSIDLARVASEEADNLLMRIFNLTNIQKNQLVLQMKEHRELNKERKEIITELGKLSNE